MNLNLYDIFSKLIPGGIVYGCLLFCNVFGSLRSKSELLNGVLIFVTGYFIDAIASALERKVIFKSFGGNPGVNLLNGENYGRIKINRLNELNIFLQSLTNTDIVNNLSNKEHLFGIIYSKVSQKGLKRVTDFQAIYSFARNILVSILICLILVTFFLDKVSITILLTLLLILSWRRCKQMNYYFTKEVIQAYIEEAVPHN